MAAAMKGSILSESLQTGRFFDLTVRCQNREFKLHKIVLHSSSKVFRDKIDAIGDQGSVIEVDDEDSSTFARLIQYLYTSSYDDDKDPQIHALAATPEARPKRYRLSPVKSSPQPEVLPPKEGESLVINMKAFSIGCKYDLPKLKSYALCKFQQRAKVFWSTPCFVESIVLLFTNTEPLEHNKVKAAVIEIAFEHLEFLISSAFFKDLLDKHGEIGRRLLQRQHRPPVEHEDSDESTDTE